MEDNDKNQILTVNLPSLIHRLGRDKVNTAKGYAAESHCELKRIRRSRNWQINGNPENLRCVSNTLKVAHPDEMNYLVSKIEQQLAKSDKQPETTQQKLTRLLLENPDMTLTELMAETNCSISEARRVRFQVDEFV